MNDNDPITTGDLQIMLEHIALERRNFQVNLEIKALQRDVSTLKKDVSTLEADVSTLEADMKRVDNKIDVLTDAVIEGFDNTERILSDWEGKPVTLISKQTKRKLQNPA